MLPSRQTGAVKIIGQSTGFGIVFHQHPLTIDLGNDLIYSAQPITDAHAELTAAFHIGSQINHRNARCNGVDLNAVLPQIHRLCAKPSVFHLPYLGADLAFFGIVTPHPCLIQLFARAFVRRTTNLKWVCGGG